MKFRLVMFAALSMSLFAASKVAAQEQPLELGVVIGEPFGVSAKYWLSDKTAVDGGVGARYGYHDRYYCDDDYYRSHGYYGDRCSDRFARLQLHADYLLHFDIPKSFPGRLPFYAGLGLRVITPYTEAGIRIPLGVSYMPASLPLDFFVELAPVITFAPYFDGDLDGGFGVRYRFGGPSPTPAKTHNSRRP